MMKQELEPNKAQIFTGLLIRFSYKESKFLSSL